MFDRQFLVECRRRALRKRVWYSALDRVERGILTLASQVTDMVRSTTLGIEIVKILAKLKDALKSGFVRHMESYGLGEARKISAQAVQFGSGRAEAWGHDFGFVRYLAFMDLNRPTGWGIP